VADQDSGISKVEGGLARKWRIAEPRVGGYGAKYHRKCGWGSGLEPVEAHH